MSSTSATSVCHSFIWNFEGSFTLGGGNGNGKIIFRRECSHWGGCQWQRQRQNAMLSNRLLLPSQMGIQPIP